MLNLPDYVLFVFWVILVESVEKLRLDETLLEESLLILEYL